MFFKNSDNAQKQKNAVIITVVLAVLLAAVVVFFVYDSSEKTNKHTGYAMGSEISVIFYGKDKKDVADDVFSQISALDNDLISRKSEKSEISGLNKNGTLELSEETLSYIKKAYEISEASEGAFDITVGGLSALWDFDSAKNTVPVHSEIEKQLSFCGYDKTEFDNYTVTIGENQILDLGALGKGIACDTAKEVFDENGIKRALVTVGGTVMTYSDSDNKGWDIGIRTPEPDVSGAFLKVHLTDVNFISTSGNYEKFFEADGKIYHHILDPETGYPAETNLKSVTVISDNGLISDALSTACYVLGRENSSSVLVKYNAQAIFVDNENNVYITDGIYDKCTLMSDAYTVYRYE